MALTPLYNEKDLLLRVSEGDEDAFKQLYRQWQPQITSFIIKMTRSKEQTADIVQDVFLKIWMTREALAGVHHFRSYLFIVSRNHAINAFRRSIREFRELKDWKIARNELQYEEPYDVALQKLSPIDEAIESLSPRQKEVYLLNRHDRLTYQEVAERLNIGKESVKTHLQLAVKAITKYLRSHIVIFFVAAIIILFFIGTSPILIIKAS